MKITSVFLHAYYAIKPASSVADIVFLKPEQSASLSDEPCYDTYHPSSPSNVIEEDLYCRLLRHQRDFVPRISLYFSDIVTAIRSASNSTSTLFRHSWRQVETLSKSRHSKEQHKQDTQKKQYSSAFINISNLAEE